MRRQQKMVEEFMQTFGQAVPSSGPQLPGEETVALRIRLIREEFYELINAFQNHDLIDAADGLADLLYVVLGTAVACGIDIEVLFNEVHRSNMTKVGGHMDEQGKWIKPDDYSPPEIKTLLEIQKEAKGRRE